MPTVSPASLSRRLPLSAPAAAARLLGLVVLATLLPETAAVDARPNVLLIAVDDLNTFSGYAAEEPGNFLQTIYPDRETRARAVARLTPNLDRLARMSAPFLRSYCQSALCGPSRTALMTGVPTHRSGYYGHSTHFRLYPTLNDAVTLPQLLKSRGYFTTGLGKIFHTGRGVVDGPLEEDWADARHSWSQWVNHPSGCGEGEPSRYSPPDGGLMTFGPSRLNTEEAADYLSADFAARLLADGSATTRPAGRRGEGATQTVTLPKDRPFFLACGLFRPHLPFHAPKEFFDRFPTSEMTGLTRASLETIIADIRDIPADGLRFSDWGGGKMKSVMEHARRLGGADAEVAAWREMVQAYLACVAFADTCIGRILEGYERSPARDNTVVVVWSDHGFHVGSKYHIAKQALWDTANNTVLLIRDPRNPASCDGTPRRQIVGLTDIYPTIAALAGAPLPGPNIGRDLSPLLANAHAPEVRDAFLMTYQPGNHALRTATHAFIRYRDGGVELYDMIADPEQQENLAGRPDIAPLQKKLSSRLDELSAGAIETPPLGAASGSARRKRSDD